MEKFFLRLIFFPFVYLIVIAFLVVKINPMTILWTWLWVVFATIGCLLITGIGHFIFYKFSKENQFKNNFDITHNIFIFLAGSATLMKVWRLPNSTFNMYLDNPVVPTILFILIANYTFYKFIISFLHRNNKIIIGNSLLF